ncbi:protein spaetzle 5 isoform X2 [Chironomus tepperi]|uniref:protein spaetzle 5 isoform X2 n=1 Tax=Chironomus tepperi TaxID=113505 RepID=UPI00391F95B8
MNVNDFFLIFLGSWNYKQMEIMKILQVAVLLLMCIDEFSIASPPCGGYGQEPCMYLPAKPGDTPACATKGSTFCEHIDGYPENLIKKLLKQHAIKDILADETKIDFNAKKESFSKSKYNIPSYEHENGHAYGPPSNGPFDNYPNLYDNHHDYNNYKNHHGYRGGYKDGNGYHYPRPAHSSSTFFQIKPSISYSFSQPQYYQRPPRQVRSILNETASEAKQLSFNRFLNVVQSVKRSKRQTSPNREDLCQVKSKYVTPQAAVNVRTNSWMYIVNLADDTQLVRTETCLSDKCSNLCQLPNGYNSKCEQRYAQKRLVTLDPQGEKLYTDIFWFPSCCVCTLSNTSD